MYVPAAFAETDPEVTAALIRANPFGLLVTGAPRPAATFVPFVLRDGFVLEAHLARENPQGAVLDGAEALAVFGGPHAYVSPSWYRTQPSVPTWNYEAVQVAGRLELMRESAEILDMLNALAEGDPGRFDTATVPEPFLGKLLKGIVAFRLIPHSVQAKRKLSQNKSVADRQGVIAGLRAGGEAVMADLIEATLPPAA